MEFKLEMDGELVVVDGYSLRFSLDEFSLPADLHSVLWSEDSGVERFNEAADKEITDLSPYEDVIAKHALLMQEERPPSPDEKEIYWGLVSGRDGRLLNTDWYALRHTDEQAIGQGTTLTEAQYQELLAYRKELRELPQKYPTSDVWVWPEEPEFLSQDQAKKAA